MTFILIILFSLTNIRLDHHDASSVVKSEILQNSTANESKSTESDDNDGWHLVGTFKTTTADIRHYFVVPSKINISSEVCFSFVCEHEFDDLNIIFRNLHRFKFNNWLKKSISNQGLSINSVLPLLIHVVKVHGVKQLRLKHVYLVHHQLRQISK